MEMLVERSGDGMVFRLDAQRFLCAVGRGGTIAAEQKREGDGCTPAGAWPIRKVLYRKDRLSLPLTALPVAEISVDDGWCDAPDDPRYNRLVKLPYRASAESLCRADDLYDVIVVLGYNDAPYRPGMGSAIFLHVAREGYSPTDGCIAVARGDLLAIVAAAQPGDCVQVAEAPIEPEPAQRIRVRYRNWRGEERVREIEPIGLRWGSTEWHPKEQWLVRAVDPDDKVEKEFALVDCDFLSVRPKA